MAKTIKIAKQPYIKGKEEYETILSYAEAYSIYKEYNDMRQMGICLQKMGAIRFELGDRELE